MTFKVTFYEPQPAVLMFSQLRVGQCFTLDRDRTGLFMKVAAGLAVVLQPIDTHSATERGVVAPWGTECLVNPVSLECTVRFI